MQPGRRRATRIGAHHSCLVGVANDVGAVQAIAIVLEVHAALIEAIDHKDRKTGGNFRNGGNLPVPQNGIDRTPPLLTEMPAFAKRQIVNYASGEVVV